MAMTCAECQERLPEYVTGALFPDDRHLVASHLSSCADCQREAALWRAVGSAFIAEDSGIPPDMSAAASWGAVRSRLGGSVSPQVAAMSRNSMRPAIADEVNSSRTSDAPFVQIRERPASRWRPYVAVAAVLLIGLLSAALFGVLGRSGRSATTISTPATCAPSQLKATLPAHASMADISMVSTTDGWAIGEVYDPQQDTTPPQTLLLRFQKCVWAPVGDAIPSARLVKIAMVSATEGWAVGATTKRQAISQDIKGQPIYDWEADQPFLLHYSGGHWQRVELPGVQRIFYVPALHMVSANEGWLLLDHGGIHTDPYTKAYSYTLLHYQHGTWASVPLTFKAPTTILWDLVATASNDCWIVGYGTALSDGGGLIAHYANGSWQTWNGVIDGVRTYTYYTVAMTSPHDVWALGNPILHFDGTTWTSAGEPALSQPGGSDLMSATMISPGEGWAFPSNIIASPNRTNELPVLHHTGGQWKAERVTVASSSLYIQSLSDLAMASPAQGWAIGAVPVRTSYGGTARGVLVYYDSGTWTVITGQD